MPTLLLLSVTAIWGSTFVVVRDAVTTMEVHPFLAWRFCLAALIMFMIKPRAVFALPHAVRVQGFVAGLALGGGYLAQTYGLAIGVSPTVSGFITGMFVVFTPIIAALLFRTKVRPQVWFAVGLACTGVGLLSLRGFAIGTGEGITLLAAALFGFHIVFLARWSSPAHAYGLTVLQLAVVAGLESLLTLATGSATMPPSRSAWYAIAFLAVFATAYGFVVQTWAQSHMSATRAAVIMSNEPVFAGIAGVITGDVLTTRIVVGAALVLIAMYVVEMSPRKFGEPKVITEPVH
jgi:drug/metabolite transporter (DMT)-like permease